jgi:hypothetical protein
MRTKQLLAVVGLGLLMTACDEPVRSLQPLYTDKDPIFEPQLLGMWVQQGDQSDDLLTFQKHEDSAYTVRVGDLPKLEGHLMKIQGELFLDLTPADTESPFVIPGHVFVKIRLNGDTLQTALLDSDWAEHAADFGTLGLSHLRIGSKVVLTTSPKELQAFVAQHAGDGSVFKNYQEYRRADFGR